MKKVLTFLTLITILGASSPAFAAPQQPSSPNRIHAGYKHEVRRPNYYYYRHYRPVNSFYMHPNYSHRLAFPHCRCPHCLAHRPQSGIGFYFSF